MNGQLSEVWCSKCDQPATTAIALTLGETRSYCAKHAWLIRTSPARKPGKGTKS